MAAPTTTELLWGTQQRPKRGPKPSLTLERIVGEAVELADAEGIANLSMARLAERLGCAKMALYRYVPGKTELNALMLDSAMGAPPAAAAAEPWRDYLRRWSEVFFQRVFDHPWALELAIGARPMGPNEMAWLETALAAMADLELNAAERFDTVVLLLGHTRSLVQQVGPGKGEDAEGKLEREMGTVLAEYGDRFPHVRATLAEALQTPIGPSGRDNALHFGIERILDGVAALIAERS
ncbi:TetR/AcrR family transcriptional regulator C-terminal domain-containing protein [Nocardia sp. 2]|uniref:TetR/AcrR family transcriptional regulator C-terminal domain-containing protein n=1 Tax=Nocardia acididurans TaxID=2802282 RepID=A0ABS1M5V6_9NOCA|nr:TetR/AcrR family transcriptional regulator [Nocardia acididurans]MBL1076027.1 TetR/AcrR family transcriptional regulator C-terminal domain-containing protein [Nocardia acididurans]